MGKDKKKDKNREDSKLTKEKKREAKRLEKVVKYLGYSSDVNPFGDSNLLQPFVWSKKKDLEKGKESNKSSKNRMDLMTEIEKARKRRIDRENELSEIERLRDEEQRLKELAQFGDWRAKEQEFELDQSRQRSIVRIVEKRPRTIDLLLKNILLHDSFLKPDISRDSYDNKLILLYPNKLNIEEIIERADKDEISNARDGLIDYYDYEKFRKGPHLEFISSLITICKVILSIFSGNQNEQVHQSIKKEVEDLLRGKSVAELDLLQKDIDLSIKKSKGSSDIEYWEKIQKEINFQRSMKFVLSYDKDIKDKVFKLIDQLPKESRKRSRDDETEKIEDIDLQNNEFDMEKEFELGDTEDQMNQSDEVFLPSREYSWQDRFRPRKPRFFNRVKTGWDRTKYNLTHYDHDNPPPKVIQGYKFTIFYPDLIDKTVTPKYFIEPCEDTDDFVIIRFHAGPPYEDIAFKILNKEWDIQKRAGFVSLFDKGILQLNFNFKRRFYRR